jgi:lipopolysaccharide export system protein LptA
MAANPRFDARSASLVLAVLLCTALPLHAEKADRLKPMEVLADKSGTADLQNQISRFSGNVVITQGTMVIKADRVEIRQTPDGFHTGTAWGTAAAPVTYRQKRDGVDEVVQGVAERVEFDGKREVLRFLGSALVRRLRGTETVDEITGALITWNHASELFTVEGGNASPGNPEGRVRAVLGPRSSAPAAPASQPAAGRVEPRR